MIKRRAFIQGTLAAGLLAQSSVFATDTASTDKPSETVTDKPADKPSTTPPATADSATTSTTATPTPPATPAADPFEAKTLDDAMQALGITADNKPEKSKDITIKAPELAESGAIIPVIITSTLKDVKEILILVADNPRPLTAIFTLMEGTEASISTRIRLDKSSDVIVLVKTADKIWTTKQAIKVNASGCEG
ncbi:MAG: thiosulfate oxidation carrier protein SoxY [Pseudomonadota bacterium]|jgi:sulfur-oxidizing protein SoxY